jgi:hypothetical protein
MELIQKRYSTLLKNTQKETTLAGNSPADDLKADLGNITLSCSKDCG